MKKALAVLLGVVVGSALALVAALLLFLPRQRPAPAEQVALTPERIERGRYLAEHVILCADCHSERNWEVFGAPARPPIGGGRECMTPETPIAGMMTGDSAFPGTLCFANVTPHPTAGIGAWSDGEIMRAIREGVDREGRGLFPIMPYFIFRSLSDEDARSLVAWLRSLEPVARDLPEKSIRLPLSLLIRLLPEPLDRPVPEPDRADPVRYGEYLATIGRCEFCHTPQEEGGARRPLPGMRFAGGTAFRGPFGTSRSANLTPHATGIGALSRGQFVALFRQHAEPRPVMPRDNTLMAWQNYAGMTEEDLGAIYAFLRTLPPVDNVVPR